MTLFWLISVICCLLLEGIYSGLEMAIVSFNKVRLHYAIAKGSPRAMWMQWLLSHPARLFGTTLLGVNLAMQIGSESSRRLYASLGFNPDFAPFTQVFIVLVLAELVPIFVARRHSESVAMLGVPIIYFSAAIMRPMLAVFQGAVHLLDLLMGVPKDAPNFFLSREEIQSIVEAFDLEAEGGGEQNTVSRLSRNLFRLRSKTIHSVLLSLDYFVLVPAQATAAQVRRLLSKSSHSHILVYDRNRENIIGTLAPRTLVNCPPETGIRPLVSTPWFIPEESPFFEVLDGFRANKQSLAIVLGARGEARGAVTLDLLLEQIFGKIAATPAITERPKKGHKEMMIERTFPGDITISELNQRLQISLPCDSALTLSQLLRSRLGHHPDLGESILIYPFELIVAEVSFLSIESVKVRTVAAIPHDE